MTERKKEFSMAAAAALLVLGVTVAHYTVPVHMHEYHNILRRLYYIPIVLAAFSYGLPGGLGCSIAVSLAYLPHAFLLAHADPSPAIEKVSELVLYNAVGAVAGFLAGRERTAAERLRRSLDDLKRMEEQLIRAGKLSALGQLASGLAHEIRNPLGSIRGAAEILGQDMKADDPKREFAAILGKEIERLNSVVTGFLEFARPRPPDKRPGDMRVAVEETLLLIAEQAAAAGVKIEKSMDAVPGTGFDPQQMKQVFLNLALNAIQAMKGGGVLRVEVAAGRSGGSEWIAVSFKDTGPGIAPENIQNIFNPFFTTKPDGTGLGLAISHRIVEAHEGRIEVESIKGGGATFKVVLPR